MWKIYISSDSDSDTYYKVVTKCLGLTGQIMSVDVVGHTQLCLGGCG